ncbi:hypothetical protein AAVH_32084, partial [Aphelenchoides avenae]
MDDNDLLDDENVQHQQGAGGGDYEHLRDQSAYGGRDADGDGGGQAVAPGGNGGGRDALRDQGGHLGGNGGNANGIEQMGKAFLSLAEQLSELQRSSRYATGLNNLKILKGTEGSEEIR